MASKPIVTGILSYGMSGRLFHAPFIETNSRFVLKGIVERSSKKAKQQYPDIVSYDSVDDLLADPDIELVIVNTPHLTHVEFAKKALQAGKHVLVEKPFAPGWEEASEVFKLADEVGKHVMVFQNRRWDSDFKLVQKVVEEGELGDLVEAHIRFDRYRSEIGPKKFKEEKNRTSGLTFDLGPHLLDQAIVLFGKPDQAVKINTIHRKDSLVDDFFSYVLSYKRGLTVFITSSLSVVEGLPAFVLHGTRGSFQKPRADQQEQQLDIGMRPDDPKFGLEPAGMEGLLSIIQDGKKSMAFKESLKGNYKGLFNAVYEQLRKDKPFPVKREHIQWQLNLLNQENWNETAKDS